MSDHHIPKQMLFGWLPQPRPPGGPRRRWRDLICKAVGVPEDSWFEATTSRASWCATYQLGLENEAAQQLDTNPPPRHVPVRCEVCMWQRISERGTRLGISALMRDRSPLVSREVQRNARGVADGSAVKVVSLYTGARGMDEHSDFLLPLAGSRDRFTAVDKQDRTGRVCVCVCECACVCVYMCACINSSRDLAR